MAPTDCILAIDQGTTSSRALVFDSRARIIARAQAEFEQLYPQPGWVEHCPDTLWQTTVEVARDAFACAEASGAHVVAIGIANQRETSLLWDRADGRPIGNAIVWQDRRTAALCRQLVDRGMEPEITHRTGLLLDPYFSATKLSWLLDQDMAIRRRANNGALAFGTVDSYLLWQLTGGKSHLTDITNASRTSLFNIRELVWDDTLLELFRIPRAVLPDVRDCASVFGHTLPALFGRALPVLGIAGDQQASALGHGCADSGKTKITYGTGGFLLVHTGTSVVSSRHRLLGTIAARLEGLTTYALEGSLFVAGAAIQWLRDELGVIDKAADTAALAASLDDNGGVYLVPAFTGLGAPHWNTAARGTICGLGRDTGRAHLARAALEASCYQTHDLLQAIHEDGLPVGQLRVDGGMSDNAWFMQSLADTLNMPVSRPAISETTALGAAWLAGHQAGLFDTLEAFTRQLSAADVFRPSIDEGERDRRLAGWRDALARTLLRGDSPQD
jgi:glycerol kinase